MVQLFWISAIGSIYSYFLYPLILLSIRSVRREGNIRISEYPNITIIITAYNEESKIKNKIENTLNLDYPANQKEIIVASDASTDDTDSIVLSFKNENVYLVRPSERKGKENAQFSAIKEASGDIIVFTDVATKIEDHALKNLVSYFLDARVGGISSEDRLVNNKGQNVGEGAYVKYEMWLRRLESNVSGLVGLSGSFFAARKEICENWDTSVPSDFNTALNCARAGKRAVTAPDVIGIYEDIKDEKKEYIRKYRTVLRGMAALYNSASILNPFKYGVFSFQIISHKVMRWLVPWFLFSLAICSYLLFDEGMIYRVVLLAQVVFYGFAILGWLSKTMRRVGFIKIPYFFMQVNLAIAHASLDFFRGKRIMLWEPSKR
jgi:cellulose synthase/poly-beta-1,6-N-acetylglucosamine synthase-like glycosyltransferase